MFKLLECYMRFFATRRIENENKILYSENETRTQKKQQTKTKWKKKKTKNRIGKKNHQQEKLSDFLLFASVELFSGACFPAL